jgi:beta-glucosidase
VIVVVGNHPLVNGRETEDRAELELPAAQERLVRAVHAANSRTVLVMSSSYPFSVCWPEQHLPALLWSAHGGQEYGRALADVLFGDSDPGGRLPQTWYRSAADLPDLLDYDIVATDATYLYYRGTPLYPFGHGLSYTSFAYSELVISTPSMAADGEVRISCTVTNTGTRAGHEVVQLYTHQQRSRVKQPLRQLRGFEHLTLAPGESRRVELTLTAADLAFYDVTRDRPCVESARHSILIGRSCTDTRLTGSIDVIGERIPLRRLASRPLAAVDFDQYCAMTLTAVAVDRGDATRAVDAGGWLGFDDIELPMGRFLCTARVSGEGATAGVLELRLDDPLRGELLGSCEVLPRTWTDIPFEVTSTQPAGTLYVVFSAAGLGLETLTFEPIAPSNGA